MRAVFFRELRRLAPYGGAVALGLLVLPLLSAIEAFGLNTKGVMAWTALLGVGLLGVATVAPDTDSGAIAFLARLPLVRRRVFAVKLAAALVWAVAALALQSVAYSWRANRPYDDKTFCVALALSFASGVLASVIANRTLPAALLAPLLGVAPLLAIVIPADVFLRMHSGSSGISLLIASSLAAAFLPIAAVTFVRGDRHRASWRPQAIGLGSVALLSVFGFSGVAAAHAWDVHGSPRWLLVQTVTESPDGKRFAVALAGRHWSADEARVAVVDRTTKKAWLLPVRDVGSPEFSPDGRLVLVRNTERKGGWLLDLETREARRLLGAWRDATDGFGSPAVLWKDGEPAFPREADGVIEVRRTGGQRISTLALAPRARLVGALGDRVFILDEHGLSSARIFEDSALTRLADLGPSLVTMNAEISRSGRHAVLGVKTRDGEDLHLCDLEKRTVRPLGDLDGIDGFAVAMSFSPDEERLALVGPRGRAIVLDLSTGERRPLEGPSSGRRTAFAWSPDSETVVLSSGGALEPIAEASGRLEDRVVAFVAAGVAVRCFRPLAFTESKTGAVLARPLEEK